MQWKTQSSDTNIKGFGSSATDELHILIHDEHESMMTENSCEMPMDTIMAYHKEDELKKRGAEKQQRREKMANMLPPSHQKVISTSSLMTLNEEHRMKEDFRVIEDELYNQDLRDD